MVICYNCPERMHAFGLFRLAPAAEVLPLAGGAYTTDVEHRLRSLPCPAHATVLHAIFDDVSASPLNHAARDRIARPQVRVVTHALSVVREVVARRSHVLQRRPAQA